MAHAQPLPLTSAQAIDDTQLAGQTEPTHPSTCHLLHKHDNQEDSGMIYQRQKKELETTSTRTNDRNPFQIEVWSVRHSSA